MAVINFRQQVAVGSGGLIRVKTVKIFGRTSVSIDRVDLAKRTGRLATESLPDNREHQAIVVHPGETAHLGVVKTGHFDDFKALCFENRQRTPLLVDHIDGEITSIRRDLRLSKLGFRSELLIGWHDRRILCPPGERNTA